MATVAWRKLPSIIKDLITYGDQYNFFQAIRLLEQFWLSKLLKLTPSSAINFPATDIKKCDLSLQNRITIQLTFMGLYGVDSTLPHYFLEYALIDNEISECIREFLNIFNNRIYSLFYLAWRKYYPAFELNQYSKYLLAISGNILTEKENSSAEFSCCGLLGARIHNSIGLAGFVSDYLAGVHTHIQQFVPNWIKLDSASKLGTNKIILGDNSFLGEYALTTTRKIIIKIGPITTSQALKLLPNCSQNQNLITLITRYLGPAIQFDIKLIIHASTSACLKLGQDQINLGWISWLGQHNKTTYYLQFPGRLLHSKI